MKLQQSKCLSVDQLGLQSWIDPVENGLTECLRCPTSLAVSSLLICRDYALWLRLSTSLPLGSLTNLPQPLIYLRKHTTNESLIRRDEQSQAANLAASVAMSQLLGRPVGEEQAALLRSPSTAVGVTVERMGEAMDLLMELERCYLKKGGQGGAGRAMVVEDVSGRLKEMAAVAMANHGPAAMSLLMKWSGRGKAGTPPTSGFVPRRSSVTKP